MIRELMQFLLKNSFRSSYLDILISSKAEKQFTFLLSEIQISIRESFALLQELGINHKFRYKKTKGLSKSLQG